MSSRYVAALVVVAVAEMTAAWQGVGGFAHLKRGVMRTVWRQTYLGADGTETPR